MGSPILDLDSLQLSSLVYVRNNINGWFFDAILRAEHTTKLRITEHPVQSGAAITDHAFLEPAELVLEVGMTDTAESIVPGQFQEGSSRSVVAYHLLLDLQSLRVPLKIFTHLNIYENMLIEVISVPDDYKTSSALKATVTFKQILVAEVTTVKLSERPQVTDSTNRGNPEPVTPNQSIIYQVGQKITGN